MKGDLHPCALRLMQSLPVRTHAWEPKYVYQEVKPVIAPIGRQYGTEYDKRGWNTSPRSIRIGSGTYRSVTEASRILHKSTKKIYEWLRDGSGRARYV